MPRGEGTGRFIHFYQAGAVFRTDDPKNIANGSLDRFGHRVSVQSVTPRPIAVERSVGSPMNHSTSRSSGLRKSPPHGRACVRQARGDRLITAPRAGGEGGIRTLDTLAGITVFETAAFDHSATSPPLLLHELTGLGQAGGGALATDLATDWLLGAWLPAGHRFAFGRRIPTRRQLPRRDD